MIRGTSQCPGFLPLMPPIPSPYQVVDHLFRHEAGRIVSVLTRIFGLDRLELAQDAVQESLLRALQVWPLKGIPENPEGWIMQVAKNVALDTIRRDRGAQDKRTEVLELYEPEAIFPDVFSEEEIQDDQLRMMFACCHPSLPPEGQIALILRTLCGFGEGEIARAFLTNRETIHKRLVRARQKLREISPSLDIPDPVKNERRFPSVLDAVYLLFNEGYNASTGDLLVRKDLCDEAIRLARLLCRHRSGDRPEAHALLALMLLHGSRLNARTDDSGNILLLQKQKREAWDAVMIREGLAELDRSASGEKLTRYHLEAGIAACHCLAPRYEDTDWDRILGLYDVLLRINESPVVSLNRIVALSHVEGAEAGIRALMILGEDKRIANYYLFHAVCGEMYARVGNQRSAREAYAKALEQTQSTAEKDFLRQRIEDLDGHE